MRFFRQVGLGVAVEAAHHHVVQQFDARHGQAGLDRQDHAVHRVLDGREAAGGGGDGFGQAVQAERQLGDDAQRALRPDQQVREVVAGGGLARLRPGADDRAVRHHRLEREDVLSDGAVADGGGAGGAGGGHAAQRGIGAGIDGEEEPGVAQVLVQALAGQAGLRGAEQVLGGDRKQPVHPREIEADAALDGEVLSFQRTGGAVGGDGRAGVGADLHDLRDLGGRLRVGHRVGRGVGVVGLVLAVQAAVGLRGDEPVSEQGGETGEGVGVQCVRHSSGRNRGQGRRPAAWRRPSRC